MTIKKIAYITVMAVCMLTFFSCDSAMNMMGMMSSPIIPESVLDSVEVTEDVSAMKTEDMLAMADTPEVANTPSVSKALVEALGEKDEEELKALEPAQKATVLDLTVNSVLPMETIMSGAANAIGSFTSGTMTEEQQKEMLTDVVSEVIKGITPVNTKATEVILESLLFTEEGEVAESIPEEQQVSVVTAVLAVTVSAATSVGDIDFTKEESQGAITDIVQSFSDKGNVNMTTEEGRKEIAETILSGLAGKEADELPQETVESMTAAIDAMYALSQMELNLESIFSGIIGGSNK